jgi:hypothetical protein
MAAGRAWPEERRRHHVTAHWRTTLTQGWARRRRAIVWQPLSWDPESVNPRLTSMSGGARGPLLGDQWCRIRWAFDASASTAAYLGGSKAADRRCLGATSRNPSWWSKTADLTLRRGKTPTSLGLGFGFVRFLFDLKAKMNPLLLLVAGT